MPIAAEHREFFVRVDGEVVPRTHQLMRVRVNLHMQRIPSAQLVYLDGAAATGAFPLSDSAIFAPGKSVEILAGALDEPTPLFHGVVVARRLKISDRASSQVTIECRHRAVRMTLNRNSACFIEATDSAVIRALCEAHGVEVEVEETTFEHPHLVQYRCTDWDFLLARAEANGLLIDASGETLAIRAPEFGGAPVCELIYGATLVELDATMDARTQHQTVQSVSWDPAQQEPFVVEADDPGLRDPGGVDPATLAAALGVELRTLHHSSLDPEEAQAWADAQWLRAQMNRITGQARCHGIGSVGLGDTVSLQGVGAWLNGPAFVTGVLHTFDTKRGWTTHIQLGGLESPLAEPSAGFSVTQAGGLLAGVNGLQIGVVLSNEDPDGEHRVLVRLPLVGEGAGGAEDGVWARVAVLDAGPERGYFFRPEIGDEVILGFLDDDPRHAVILGMLHSSNRPPHLKGTDDNHEKGYRSREGLALGFNEETRTITIATPKQNAITLSEEEEGITLADQNGNAITMHQDGIVITSASALTLKASSPIELASDADVVVKAGGAFKAEGTSGASLTSTATTVIKGGMVEIN